MPTTLGIKTFIWAMARQSRRIGPLFYANGGIGDELMLTAIARQARLEHRPLHVITELPALWEGNPDPASLETGVERWFYAQRRGWLKTKITHLAYQNGQNRHIADQMAEHLGLTLPAGWRPVLHVEKAPRRDPRLVVVQNSCSGARYSATTKEWPQSSWRELVRRLAGRSWIVQIGSPSDPPLDAAEDLRGRTTLREAATLLSGAASFVGLESGLQHVAAAMHTPSVIIYGGRSRPCETGYPFNHNITRSPACAGCGLNTGCPHGMLCMEIPVEEVAAAVNGVIVPNAPV